MTLKSLKETLKNIISWIKNPDIKWSTDSAGSRFFRVTNTSNEGVGFGYGSGQANHGIWSEAMDKWMIYSDGSKEYLYDASKSAYVPTNQLNNTVQSISTNMTSSTGTYVSSNCKRSGNVVWFSIAVRNTSSVAAGSNIYQGTVSSTLPRPYSFTSSGTYYGNHAVNGSINSDRTVIIRNASSSAFSIGSSSSCTVSFCYVTQD